MALEFRKFPSLTAVRAFLQGHLIGGVPLSRTPSSLYLHGKTLIFSTPSATVTFAATPAGAQVALTLAEVRDQIEAQASGVSVHYGPNGFIELFLATPGPIILDKDGTANSQLGFDSKTDTGGAIFTPVGGDPPNFVQLVPEPGSNSYVVVTDET